MTDTSPRPPLLTSLALALSLASAGCSTLRTTYEPPALAMPTQWQQADHGPARDAREVTGQWWKAFADPVLAQLVDAALQRNNDLAAAAVRVRKAQLQARLNENRPDLSARLNASASQPLDGGSSSSSSSSATSLGVSYEVDLWGRLDATQDAARWEALASVQDREAVAQALAATTATLYWQLAYYNQRLAAAAQSIAYAERTQALVQAQYEAGAVSALEAAESRQSLASQRAALTQLQQRYVETSNALVLLFDGSPLGPAAPGWAAPQALPATDLPPVAAGLPAQLLAQRPDLRAAELRLRSTLATADAARLSFYPQLSLTGALGSSSAALGNLLANPIATLGAGLALPFLNQTEMRLRTESARADYELAVIQFRQTLYQALSDVNNALSARAHYNAQGEQLAQALADARRAEELYEVRYRAGAVALKPWLDAQEKRRTAETALAENKLNRLINHATLFQALGSS